MGFAPYVLLHRPPCCLPGITDPRYLCNCFSKPLHDSSHLPPSLPLSFPLSRALCLSLPSPFTLPLPLPLSLARSRSLSLSPGPLLPPTPSPPVSRSRQLCLHLRSFLLFLVWSLPAGPKPGGGPGLLGLPSSCSSPFQRLRTVSAFWVALAPFWVRISLVGQVKPRNKDPPFVGHHAHSLTLWGLPGYS